MHVANILNRSDISQKDHSDQFSKYRQAFQENMKTIMINQALMRQAISQIKTTNVSESTRLLTPTRETLVQDGTSLNLASSDIKVPQNPAPSQTPQEHPEDQDQKDLEVIPTIKTEPLTIIQLKPNQAFGLSPRAYQKFKELRHKQARIVLKRLPLNKLLDKSPKRTSRPLRWLGPVVKKLCLPWPIESAKNKQSGNNRGPTRKKSNRIPAAAEDKLQWSTLSDGCTSYGSLCGIKHPAEVTRKSQPEPWPVMPGSDRSNTPDHQTEHTAKSLRVVGKTMNTLSKNDLKEALETGSSENSSNTIKPSDDDDNDKKDNKHDTTRQNEISSSTKGQHDLQVNDKCFRSSANNATQKDTDVVEDDNTFCGVKGGEQEEGLFTLDALNKTKLRWNQEYQRYDVMKTIANEINTNIPLALCTTQPSGHTAIVYTA